ncbi:sushi, von Willebrand factor type A, EGF and pentraxin domain-containing protein 1-like [Pollicipes pollicipes]|uniref:sushi, von Willebrand factor type A, EGF and pentraxin domain-containing protein 1-like n=1 Tax=Pollicipes pollicipes TaxID=41117 RepID=UPI001884B132|nr:sushi, von Willebrand factor type A, EGF and pentraxin domain-containing protein 1-like [Pollicipes pollicipes]
MSQLHGTQVALRLGATVSPFVVDLVSELRGQRTVGRVRERLSGDCNGHGRASFGRCRCDRRSYGERCQFSNECEQDSHCGTYGKCIDLAATTYPKKQCFCRLGFFGKDCAQRNPAGMRKKITNFGLYQKREMSRQ